MTSISVQCRLMPDIQQNGEQCLPGLFYNILVSASDEKGGVIPCTVKFRATSGLNDLVHKSNGTGWSKGIKASMFGSVLWSINALTDTLPPPIEVQVEAAGASNTIVVQPVANLLAMLQKLSEKTVDEWCGFLSKGYHATNLMHFAASALSVSSGAVYSALMKSPSGANLALVIKEGYDQQSGILTAGEATNSLAAKAVTSTVTARNAKGVFMALMKAAEDTAGASGQVGAVLKNFINDASELFQVMQLLLEQCGREVKDVFDWIDLNLPWEDIGSAHELLKSVSETLIKDLIGSNGQASKGWSDVVSSFGELWEVTSSKMGEQMKGLMPVAKGLQQTWSENSPKLSQSLQINHQQFEMGWIGWRLTHSMPSGLEGPEDLIKSILSTLDFSRLSKALDELTSAMSGLDMSEELKGGITLIQTFFAKTIKGDTSQIEQLLSGGPELEAIQAAPGEFFKLINQLKSKGESVIELVHACLELVHDFITAPIEMPFLDALKPWLNPPAVLTTKQDVSCLDLIILGVVTPGVVLFKSATNRASFSLKDLQDMIGEDWSLNDIPVKDFVQKLLTRLTEQSEQVLPHQTPTSHKPRGPHFHSKKAIHAVGGKAQAREASLRVLPDLTLPSDKFPDPPPYFKEVCDGLCLFFELCGAISEAMADIINLIYEAEEIAISVAASGNEAEESATDTVNWTETAKEFLTLSYESFGFCFSTTVNLIKTVELYVLNEDPKAKWVYIDEVQLVAFNPVYPKWVGLANSGYALASNWAFLLVDFIMKLSEDEELGAGAADFEISGAAYTEVDVQMTEFLGFVKKFNANTNWVVGVFISKTALWNELLYEDVPEANVIPMANSVMELMIAGKDGNKRGSGEQAENIGEMISPWHDWEFTKLVCEQVGEASRDLSKAKDLIEEIPEYGSELAFSWDLGCVLVANTMSSFSLAISVYQFNETYQAIDQAKDVANHK